MGTVAYQPYIDKAIEERNNRIVKEVIIEDYNNVSGEEIMTICGKIDNGKGERYDSCVDQLDGSEKSGYSESVTKGYWKAVAKGYSGTIEQFSKKKDTISKALGYAVTAGGILSGLASSKSNQGGSYAPVPEETTDNSRRNKIIIISSVVLALGIIGVIVYKNR
jgi:hypothetical protein